MTGTIKKQKRIESILVAALLISVAILGCLPIGSAAPIEVSAATKSKKTVKVTDREVRKFLKRSAFVGNSITIRRKKYHRRKGKGYLGGPKFVVHQGYSIHSDLALNHKWCLHYRGSAIHCEDYLRKIKAKRVFIQLGTNDLQVGVSQAYKNYKTFIKRIKSRNPGILIFIESTFPCNRNLGRHLTPKTIRRLNKKVKKYIRTQKNVYYIDLHKDMANKKGRLKKEYADDATHPNRRGIKKWDRLIFAYVKQFLRNKKLGIGNDRGKKIGKGEEKELEIIFWDSEEKKLYFNNGKAVTGDCVYKNKIYCMTSKGKYREAQTEKVRAASKPGMPVAPLIELLGKPDRVTISDSCLEPGGKDGVYQYKHFDLLTYRGPRGIETVQGLSSRY